MPILMREIWERAEEFHQKSMEIVKGMDVEEQEAYARLCRKYHRDKKELSYWDWEIVVNGGHPTTLEQWDLFI